MQVRDASRNDVALTASAKQVRESHYLATVPSEFDNLLLHSEGVVPDTSNRNKLTKELHDDDRGNTVAPSPR